mgnify:CR=1 FL=1
MRPIFSNRIFYLLLVILVLFFSYQYFTKNKQENIEFNSSLIEKEIKNVSKLIVTEGHYAEVLTYKDQQKYLLDLISFEKKALIVANADVFITYDMRQLEYKIDEVNKTITITNLPEPELKINQDLNFYDVNQSRFNPFGADDYNKIQKKVKEVIKAKVEKSTLKSNAENRFLTELSKILVLTNTMGWKLQYNGNTITSEQEMQVKL